ncbi:MAG: bifunctional adenosylcobinamide kinase/adenosylcobinamide-phosphate guanylyltransferase [Bacillota bacterium]
MPISLIIGGARSGKSSYGEKLAASISENVGYVATAQAFDEEMQARIAAHRKNRPQNWVTYEEPISISDILASNQHKHDVFLIDCLTLLITNILLKGLNIDNLSTSNQQEKEKEVLVELGKVVSFSKVFPPEIIIVTNEIGLGIVPANNLSRVYRDIAGRANQFMAENARRVIFTCAGIPLQIKPTLERL